MYKHWGSEAETNRDLAIGAQPAETMGEYPDFERFGHIIKRIPLLAQSQALDAADPQPKPPPAKQTTLRPR